MPILSIIRIGLVSNHLLYKLYVSLIRNIVPNDDRREIKPSCNYKIYERRGICGHNMCLSKTFMHHLISFS